MSESDNERRLRINLMITQEERLRQEIRTENRKFIVQIIVGGSALIAVGVALGRFLLFHT